MSIELKVQVVNPDEPGEVIYEQRVAIDGEPGEDLANGKSAILQAGMELLWPPRRRPGR